MKRHRGVRVCAVAIAALFMASAVFAATPTTATPPAQYNPNVNSGWRIISYSVTTDGDGNIVSKTGYQTFGGKDAEGHTISGVTTMTFKVFGGIPTLASSYTKETSSWVEDGESHSRTDESWTTNNLNNAGMLTGGSNKSTFAETVKDNSGALVSTTTGSSNSTKTAIKNGQLQILESKGSSTTKDKDGKQISSGTFTVTNTYGNYSGGKWNVTQTVQTSDSSAVGTEQKDHRVITTNMTYDGNGNLLTKSGSGTSSGRELTENGWANYTGTITIKYKVEDGIAVQMAGDDGYKEIRVYTD